MLAATPRRSASRIRSQRAIPLLWTAMVSGASGDLSGHAQHLGQVVRQPLQAIALMKDQHQIVETSHPTSHASALFRRWALPVPRLLKKGPDARRSAQSQRRTLGTLP